jgi:imidazolonepropionase-like amidohydrolase
LFPGLCTIALATKAQTFALRADRLIDGKSDKQLLNPTVVIHKNKIVDVNFESIIPDSAQLIDLTGYTLLPGLIDAHTHALLNFQDQGDYEKDIYYKSSTYRALRAVSFLKTSLLNGFTTIRDVCTEGAGYADVDLSRAVDQGLIVGPRVVPSARGIAATGQYFPRNSETNWDFDLPDGTDYVTGVDACRRSVREQISRGAKWVKVFADFSTPTLTQEELNAIVDEANKYGVQVAAHANWSKGIELAIKAGVRSIEHGVNFNEYLIELAISKNVFWCPTITVLEFRNYNELPRIYGALNKAYRMGLKIVLGSDAGAYPWTVNQTKELTFYVEKAGFTPIDAIKCGTSNAAELLGRGSDLGQVRINFIADLIAVKGNLLDDISLIEKVDFVMKEGKIYKSPNGVDVQQ